MKHKNMKGKALQNVLLSMWIQNERGNILKLILILYVLHSQTELNAKNQMTNDEIHKKYKIFNSNENRPIPMKFKYLDRIRRQEKFNLNRTKYSKKLSTDKIITANHKNDFSTKQFTNYSMNYSMRNSYQTPKIQKNYQKNRTERDESRSTRYLQRKMQTGSSNSRHSRYPRRKKQRYRTYKNKKTTNNWKRNDKNKTTILKKRAMKDLENNSSLVCIRYDEDGFTRFPKKKKRKQKSKKRKNKNKYSTKYQWFPINYTRHANRKKGKHHYHERLNNSRFNRSFTRHFVDNKLVTRYRTQKNHSMLSVGFTHQFEFNKSSNPYHGMTNNSEHEKKLKRYRRSGAQKNNRSRYSENKRRNYTIQGSSNDSALNSNYTRRSTKELRGDYNRELTRHNQSHINHTQSSRYHQRRHRVLNHTRHFNYRNGSNYNMHDRLGRNKNKTEDHNTNTARKRKTTFLFENSSRNTIKMFRRKSNRTKLRNTRHPKSKKRKYNYIKKLKNGGKIYFFKRYRLECMPILNSTDINEANKSKNFITLAQKSTTFATEQNNSYRLGLNKTIIEKTISIVNKSNVTENPIKLNDTEIIRENIKKSENKLIKKHFTGQETTRTTVAPVWQDRIFKMTLKLNKKFENYMKKLKHPSTEELMAGMKFEIILAIKKSGYNPIQVIIAAFRKGSVIVDSIIKLNTEQDLTTTKLTLKIKEKLLDQKIPVLELDLIEQYDKEMIKTTIKNKHKTSGLPDPHDLEPHTIVLIVLGVFILLGVPAIFIMLKIKREEKKRKLLVLSRNNARPPPYPN